MQEACIWGRSDIWHRWIDSCNIFTDPCTENEVRLNGEVVEVCHESKWGFVCSSISSWSVRSAAVVCQQVGMGYRGESLPIYSIIILTLCQ